MSLCLLVGHTVGRTRLNVFSGDIEPHRLSIEETCPGVEYLASGQQSQLPMHQSQQLCDKAIPLIRTVVQHTHFAASLARRERLARPRRLGRMGGAI